jgi:16S rRNA (guanine966-N2)-methyltransferase
MRIVGGEFRGRPLKGPSTQAVRPTSDRLRESLFNIIAHNYPGALEGVRVIDLFAGTGALGLEAISRGARFGLFVDDSTEGRALTRENVEALSLGGRTRIFRVFDLAFLDPPYGKGLAPLALVSLRDGGWLTPGALVLVEEEAGADIGTPEGYQLLEKRTYGDTQMVFLRRAPL